MDYFNSIYTLIEIAINNGIDNKRIKALSRYMDKKDEQRIRAEFYELEKFLPYCNWYVIQEKNVLCMSAYYYDIYKDTGILPNIEVYDFNPDIEKLEHWQYINPVFFEMNPETDFEFAEKYFKDCNIWSLFLSGCARMDYYQGSKVTTEQRIKYAMVEYMMRRPQFFSTEDFTDNPIIHKKLRKEKNQK